MSKMNIIRYAGHRIEITGYRTQDREYREDRYRLLKTNLVSYLEDDFSDVTLPGIIDVCIEARNFRCAENTV